MSLFNLAQSAKLVEAITPQASGAITGDYVSSKTAGRVFVVVHVNQASAVAETGSKAITTAVPIWVCESCAASDALVRKTDAVAYTTTAGTTHKLVVFEVDPSTLDKGKRLRLPHRENGGLEYREHHVGLLPPDRRSVREHDAAECDHRLSGCADLSRGRE